MVKFVDFLSHLLVNAYNTLQSKSRSPDVHPMPKKSLTNLSKSYAQQKENRVCVYGDSCSWRYQNAAWRRRILTVYKWIPIGSNGWM